MDSLFPALSGLRINGCLSFKPIHLYGCDPMSTQSILEKLKPLIDDDKHHIILNEFIEVSASHADTQAAAYENLVQCVVF